MKNKKIEVRNFKSKSAWLNLLVLVGFLALSILFEVLCLRLVTNTFVVKFKTPILIGVILLTLFLSVLFAWSYLRKKDTLHKLTITVFILLIFILIVFYVMLKSGFFAVIHSTEKFQEYLKGAGDWMWVAYIVLQFLQVLILPIPSFVSVAAGWALFGAVKTLIYSFIAIVPASIIAFFVGRKLGVKAVSWMIGEDTLEKWQNKLKGKDNLVLTTMFLLPLFPDDILCFVAGLSTMTNRYFLIMIVICRLVNLTTTTFSIDLIPFTTWWGILLWIAFGVVFGLAFLYIYKNTDKISDWAKAKFAKKNKQSNEIDSNNENKDE